MIFLFFMIFIEKNKGFARLLSREASGASDEQECNSTAVNQFFERFELYYQANISLSEDTDNLIHSTPGISAQHYSYMYHRG